MADPRADTLIELIDYLTRLEAYMRTLVHKNHACVARTASQLGNAFAQVARSSLSLHAALHKITPSVKSLI